MIKVSNTQKLEAIKNGFLEEMSGIEKTAYVGIMTGGAKLLAGALGRTTKFLAGSKYRGGTMQTAFSKALGAYKAQGGKAMIGELAQYSNPLWYKAKGVIPKYHPVQQRRTGWQLLGKPSARRGALHAVGTTAAKIKDLTMGMKGKQNIFRKTYLFGRNIPRVAIKDIRGSFMYKSVVNIEKQIASGKAFAKVNGKILSKSQTLRRYRINPEVAIKDMYMRRGFTTKGTRFARQFKGTTGVKDIYVHKRKTGVKVPRSYSEGIIRKRKAVGAFSAAYTGPGLGIMHYLGSKTDVEGKPRSQAKRVAGGLGQAALWGIHPAIGTAGLGIYGISKILKRKRQQNWQQTQLQ